MAEPNFAPMTCPTCGKQTEPAISMWRCGCGEELHGPEIDVDLRAAYERGRREMAERAAKEFARGHGVVTPASVARRILALLDKKGGGDG